MRLYKPHIYAVVTHKTVDTSCTNRVTGNEWLWHHTLHSTCTLSGATEQRPPSLLQLNSVLLPGRGGEMVQGEWASPHAARRCEQRSRETKSCHVQGGRGSFWLERVDNLQRIEPVLEVGSMVSSDILVLVYY